MAAITARWWEMSRKLMIVYIRQHRALVAPQRTKNYIIKYMQIYKMCINTK